MQPAPEHQTQADFARHMKVSRAAVSQWRKKDILREDAFTQPGKKGKVIVSVAIDQVRQNRDIGQSLGNGIGTKTTIDAPDLPLRLNDDGDQLSAPQTSTADDTLRINTVEDQLKRAKLEEQLRRNRTGASEEALRQGLLMASDDVREQMSRIATMMLQIFEGALPDLAASMAAKFDVPQRDVLHLLRADFKKVRATAAMKEKARAGTTTEGVMATVDLE